ncbi:putative signal transduction protein with CBS domains [Pyrolobus fumarii 1A]|uniref:Putative signal transduction protein with CBS domains n=2 Tax=Pyrolobus fumarii TaxID=54252 RepID=G0EFX0_PYRF1|nr:putative signal transduction protein with CBS domains [Pyrolobus fumarii 1A]
MSTSLVTARPEEPVREVVKRMVEHSVGSVLIVDDEGRLAGIFTERDLARLVARGASLEEPVSKYMSRSPVTASPDEPLAKIATKMIEHWLRHIPVVDEQGRPLGVISIRDVLRVIASFESFP